MTAEHGHAALPDYPAYGGRPTAVVRVEGGGKTGVGECVAWTAADQERFAAACPAELPPGHASVGEIARRLERSGLGRYARAALEAAVVDLALRQAGTSLFRLAGVEPRPVSFVVSFGALSNPAGELRALRKAAPGARVKLDVDPHWSPAALRALADLRAVAVLDLKLRGDLALAERVHAAVPEALVEDPRLDPRPRSGAHGEPVSVEDEYAAGGTPAGVVGERAAEVATPSLLRRASFDAPVLGAADVGALPFSPAAVNMKPARIGGLLEALRTVAACRAAGVAFYVGGMFEAGPGRRQAQALASLFSPDAPNDVAPLRTGAAERRVAGPLQVPTDFVGLGFP